MVRSFCMLLYYSARSSPTEFASKLGSKLEFLLPHQKIYTAKQTPGLIQITFAGRASSSPEPFQRVD